MEMVVEIYNIKDFKGGWFIGNFEPSLIRTEGFEVGVNFHPSGSYWAPHYHKVATEITYLMSGRMEICGKTIEAGQLFVIPPLEPAAPIFLTDCHVVIVKTPSVPGDKYLLSENL